MAETVGEAVELQPVGGAARAVTDERDGIVDEIRVYPAAREDRLVGEQLDPVVYRCNRPAQLMTQTSCQELQHTQIEVGGNHPSPWRHRNGHFIGNPVEPRS